MSLREVLKKKSIRDLVEIRAASVKSNDEICIKAIDAEIASRIPKEHGVCPTCGSPTLSNDEVTK